MKKLPVDIRGFRRIIQGGYVYVDKTQYIYRLLDEYVYCFLSRPRRFGKSLLLSTIGEMFSGDRELFKGLWIDDSDYSFEKHPVIRLDMSNIPNETPEVLKEELTIELKNQMKKEALTIESDILSDIFKLMIEDLSEKYNQRVVVLIDEYDKPILDHIPDIERADANRVVLRDFYGILKSMEDYIHFVFVTGVSGFACTSMSSGLNNLHDISLMEEYAGICGVSTQELDTYFSEHIMHLSSLPELKRHGDIRSEILKWYGGYSWDGETRVLNPFSLLSCISDEQFLPFWYRTGSPRFLKDLIRQNPEGYAGIGEYRLRAGAMDDVFGIDAMQTVPLLFQTGYLTIDRELDETPLTWSLKIPNLEVDEAFNVHMLAALTSNQDEAVRSASQNMRGALLKGDLEEMRELMKGLLSQIPYELHQQNEAYYHSIIYTAMRLLGLNMGAEVSVSGGRVDALLEIADRAYVLEFKYTPCPKNASAERKQKLFDKALDEGAIQIFDRGYADRYVGSGRKVTRAAFAILGRNEIEMRIID